MLLLEGKPVAERLKDTCNVQIDALALKGVVPSLAIVRVGNAAADIWYEKAATKALSEAGCKVSTFEFSADTPASALLKVLDDLSHDRRVSSILLMRPLPAHLKEEELADHIVLAKDADGLSDAALAKILRGQARRYLPCTPRAVMHLLDFYHIDLAGAKALVIGRSLVVGKPLAAALLERDATVSLAHSKTLNLAELSQNADIVFTCMGRPHYLDEKFFSEKSVVVDIGTAQDEEGHLTGDVDFDAVAPNVKAITPVPGGVGAITTACLLEAVVHAAEEQCL